MALSTEIPPEGYRRNVGICLINTSKKIFTGWRIQIPHTWQMPQGGADEGEDSMNRGHCPNAVTFTTLINGYYKIGDLGLVHKLLDEMRECGVVPNSLTCSVLSRWVFRRRDVEYERELMRKLWERMKDENDPNLNIAAFANLIVSLCKEGFFNEVFRIAEETPQGMSVNEELAYGHMNI
ncbi:hypothetical protein SLA2020_396290 [Shorea laevis]